MKLKMKHLLLLIATLFSTAIFAKELKVTTKPIARGVSVTVENAQKYLLLPIEESAPTDSLIIEGEEIKFVRLARKKIDYYVPLEVSKANFSFEILNLPKSAIALRSLQSADEWVYENTETHRPHFHFTPTHGWMNDPNGMVYRDGVYHLYYQWDPLGSAPSIKWWGHATSTDLVNWEDHPAAIEPDPIGSIYSGSAIIDKNNDAGFGKDALLAFYTQHVSDRRPRQIQSVAYSLDGGETFIKYEGNPILEPAKGEDQVNFRDPKMLYHEPSGKWIMVLVASEYVKFYSSTNLIDWTFESQFGGEEYNLNRAKAWECADLIQMPLEGKEDVWVLIINHGAGPFGGSATQYYTGTFDGSTFKEDSKPKNMKWMDYGMDHYATVTWANTPRTLAIGWMSNLSYSRRTPTQQYRSAQTVVRELSLFEHKGEVYLASAPVPELESLRKECIEIAPFSIEKSHTLAPLSPLNEGVYEIEMTLDVANSDLFGFTLSNDLGEEVDCYIKTHDDKIFFDRNKSGYTKIIDKFTTVSAAPLWGAKRLKMKILVDRSSIEIFINDGKSVLTNIVFPTKPYDTISFYNVGAEAKVSDMRYYPLKKSINR